MQGPNKIEGSAPSAGSEVAPDAGFGAGQMHAERPAGLAAHTASAPFVPLPTPFRQKIEGEGAHLIGEAAGGRGRVEVGAPCARPGQRSSTGSLGIGASVPTRRCAGYAGL